MDGRWGLKQGFEKYDDEFDLKKYKQLDLGKVQRPGDQVIASALEWLETQKNKAFFCWIHLYDPHAPYEPPEPYLSRYGAAGLTGLYDGEIAFMDAQIGRLTQWLEEQNLDQKTILALMGDHGEGLGDHGELSHGYFIYDYAVHVPFLMITPFKELQGIRVRSQVRSIDLYPTLLEMTGAPIPKENQGESLLPLLFNTGAVAHRLAYSESMTPAIQYGWGALHSLRTGKYKYIEAPHPELYDLTSDALEKNNLIRRLTKLSERFKTDLKQIMEISSTGAPAPESANLDGETLQRLATLGYIGGPTSRKTSSKGLLPDPKEKLEIFEAISLAGELVSREKYDDAATKLEQVLKNEPDIPQALLLLANCYEEMGRVSDAKVQLDHILKDDPNSVQALIGLASILSEEGKTEDVLTLCKKAISVDDRNTMAYSLIGEVYMGVLDHANALPYLKKAVEIQPKMTRNAQNLAVCLIGMKQYPEAEKLLTDITAKNPKFPLSHFHLGLAYDEQGKYLQAQKEYELEIANYKEYAPAHFNLGKVLLQLNDFPGYMKKMREVIALAPHKAEGYLFLARGLLRTPDADNAEILQMMEKGIALAQPARLKALGYFLLADFHSRNKNSARLRDALEKANHYKSLSEKEPENKTM